MVTKQAAPSNRQIIQTFLKTGTISFGGWSTTAVLLEKELGSKTYRHNPVDLKVSITYGQILPGATQVAIVSNTGYQLKGFIGALLATVSYLLPAVSLVTLFAIIYFGYLQERNITDHMGGLIAALSGIILANACRIGRKHVTHPLLWALIAGVCLAQVFAHMNALLIILIFGAAGLAKSAAQTREKTV